MEFHRNQTPDLSYLRRRSNHSATSAVEKVVQRLLKEERMDVNTRDWDELMPLIPAASTGHVNVIKLLLREGATASQPSWRRASWDTSR